MDLYDIRGGRLGVIKEEAEYQDTTTAMDRSVSVRAAQGDATFPRLGEDATPSPTGADDGQDDVEGLKDQVAEVGNANLTLTLHLLLIPLRKY